jgi:hypothetical protein
VPGSTNTFDTRTFNWLNAAPRPQLIAAHAPMSSNLAVPSASNPSNAKARSAMSSITPSAFRSRPSAM